MLSTPISSIFKISIFFSLALIVEFSEALLRGVAVGVNDIRDGSFNFNIWWPFSIIFLTVISFPFSIAPSINVACDISRYSAIWDGIWAVFPSLVCLPVKDYKIISIVIKS